MNRTALILVPAALLAGAGSVVLSGVPTRLLAAESGAGRSALLEPNPLAIRGSTYGALFSNLAEDDVDRVWHVGLQAQVHASGTHWLARAREAKSSRNNPRPLGRKHRAAIRHDLRAMLENALLLDPGSFTIYEALHLFLTTDDESEPSAADADAREAALLVLAWVSGEDEDPEPWLAAAAASLNLHLTEAAARDEEGDQPGPQTDDRDWLSQAEECLSRFDSLRAGAASAGLWEKLSEDRRSEIATRREFLGRVATAWRARQDVNPVDLRQRTESLRKEAR